MTEEQPKKTSLAVYFTAAAILTLLGIIFIGMVLFLRPNIDPLIVITSVLAFTTTIGTGVAAFIKSQETHDSVNGKLAAWKKEFFALAHAQGVIDGTEKEQGRMAEKLRLQNINESAPVSSHATPVVVENIAPIAVKETPGETPRSKP
jgi:hypothetical protein